MELISAGLNSTVFGQVAEIKSGLSQVWRNYATIFEYKNIAILGIGNKNTEGLHGTRIVSIYNTQFECFCWLKSLLLQIPMMWRI